VVQWGGHEEGSAAVAVAAPRSEGGREGEDGRGGVKGGDAAAADADTAAASCDGCGGGFLTVVVVLVDAGWCVRIELLLISELAESDKKSGRRRRRRLPLLSCGSCCGWMVVG